MATGKFVVGKERELPKKESVEAIAFGVSSPEPDATSGEGKEKYFKEGEPWVHPPEKIIAGEINYRCKLLGTLPTTESKGSAVVKDTVDSLRMVREVKQGKIEPLKDVDLNISLRSLTVFVAGTKEILHQHPLRIISFCSDDKRAKSKTFAYIARDKPKSKEHVCYAFEAQECDAAEITSTIGQAFEMDFRGISSGEMATRKELPKKESVEAIAFRAASLEPDATSGEGKKKYFFKEGKPWVHPPEKIIAGEINYRCKLLGTLPTTESKGSAVVKDIIDRFRLVREVKQGKIEPLKDVDLNISLRSLTVFVAGTKEILHQHPLHSISFCSDDKRGKSKTFAYIARGKPKSKEHVCYAFEAQECDAEEITSTIGQAFDLAFERFQETKKAQELQQLKGKLKTQTEQADFAKQLAEIQKNISEMERESVMNRTPQVGGFTNVTAQWESIVEAMEPFAMEPKLDPGTMYLVPRPETKALDSAVLRMETHIKHLQEASEHPLHVHRLRNEDFSEQYMEDIEGQVRSIQLESEGMEEPDLPSNYEMKEYVQAKEKAKIPKGTVKDVSSTWEDRAKHPE